MRRTAGTSLALFTTVLALFAAPFAVEAQPTKVSRIGVLSLGSPGPSRLLDAFRGGLRELGYVERENIAVEYRSDEEKPDRLADLAAELVRLKLVLQYHQLRRTRAAGSGAEPPREPDAGQTVYSYASL